MRHTIAMKSVEVIIDLCENSDTVQVPKQIVRLLEGPLPSF